MELLTQLRIDLIFEPRLVLHRPSWTALSSLDGGFIVSPEADPYDQMGPPVLAENDGHPFQHGLESR